MRQKFYLLSLVFSFIGFASFAQTGEIKGRVTEKGVSEGVPFASVAAMLNGVQVLATTTDIDGYFDMKPLTPGVYDVKATCVGFNVAELKGVIITADKFSVANMELSKGVELKEVNVYAVPLIDPGTATTQVTKTYDEIQQAAVRDVNSIVSQSAGVYQNDVGGAINVRGGRSDATAYYVDGVRVEGGIGISNKGIEQITTITGGTPAQYGDATSGVVSVTTRGPSKEYTGGIEVSSSKLFDDYNNNTVSFSLSGPIFTERDSVGRKSGAPKAGFFVAGDYYYDGDPSPSAIGAWVVKPDKLAEIQAKPLIPSKSGIGYDQQADYLTYSDLDHLQARPNAASKGYRANAKLDFRPVKNVTLALGGSFDHSLSRNYIGIYALMNSDNNSQSIFNQYRAWARITQRFGTSENDAKSASVIKNAFYMLQFDYTNNKGVTQNDKHEDRIFDYGYVGQFITHQGQFYSFAPNDSIHGIDQFGNTVTVKPTTPTVLQFYYDSLVEYHASDLNPNTAAYTNELFGEGALYSFNNTSQIQQVGGLINQDNRTNLNVYGLWASTGRIQNSFGKAMNEQFGITAQGSADIKKHNIVFGMEYQQRVERSYALNPSSLWLLMRQYEQQNTLNRSFLDTSAQHTHIYYGTDTTVIYDVGYAPTRNLNGDIAPGFHENIHSKLGIANNGFVDIDAYSPSTYSLDLFTPDQLSPIVGYYGYDYKGNVLSTDPSLYDFFYKTDANNNFTREVGAFRPNYVAGYIQDKFSVNDLNFNIGVRVDRFDANQKALKDKYLLWPAYTAGSIPASSGLLANYSVPSNIGDDYTVYVNDLKNPTSIVGYRKDDKWYDAQGQQISDVSTLVNGSGGAGSTIQPYLINPGDATGQYKRIDLNAFKDYEPQTTVMPRISFSFPISDEAYFAAHYDILTQRPNEGLLRFNPFNYLYMSQGLGGTIANPDLKPQRTTDYEIVFQQVASKTSVFSISAFYREMRDMMEFIAVNFAYPVTYYTYGNVDFGTVKGLTFSYDLRKTGNVRLNAAYTLQFADGTGSDPNTNLTLVQAAGQSNLREIKPLDFDQRHTFTASLDYHYGSGKSYDGPVWWNKQFFANAGVNLALHAGSGTPYTRQSNITPTADFTSAANGRSVVEGSINGSRLPWNFRIDAKVDKSFEIKMGHNKDGVPHRPLNMMVYLQVTNLLNALNIQSVYRATGNPDDDGYIHSADGTKAASGMVNPQSYIDLYQIAVNNPGNYSLPRLMRLGVQLTF